VGLAGKIIKVALPHDREGFSFDEGFSSNERKILRDHRLPSRQLDISRITGASYGRISGLPFLPSVAATTKAVTLGVRWGQKRPEVEAGAHVNGTALYAASGIAPHASVGLA
jgi:hypothetical protein